MSVADWVISCVVIQVFPFLCLVARVMNEVALKVLLEETFWAVFALRELPQPTFLREY